MTAQEFVDMLALYYRTVPSNNVISIGHWNQETPPHFYADIGVTVGELQDMSAAAHKR